MQNERTECNPEGRRTRWRSLGRPPGSAAITIRDDCPEANRPTPPLAFPNDRCTGVSAHAVGKRSTVVSPARVRACHRSYATCIPSHVSGVEPKASDRRIAISTETPGRPFSNSESACRMTPSARGGRDDREAHRQEPDILGGTSVFPGTRVPVRILMEHLEAGDPLDDFLDDYPTVTREQAVELLKRTTAQLVDDPR